MGSGLGGDKVLVRYARERRCCGLGSPAKGTTGAFLWVNLPIVAVPWTYVFVAYIYNPKNWKRAASRYDLG